LKIIISETKSHMTSDDLESHIVVNVSSTLTNTTIWFVAALSFIVDVRMDGQTFLPGLLGHVTGDDLKKLQFIHIVNSDRSKTAKVIKWQY